MFSTQEFKGCVYEVAIFRRSGLLSQAATGMKGLWKGYTRCCGGAFEYDRAMICCRNKGTTSVPQPASLEE